MRVKFFSMKLLVPLTVFFLSTFAFGQADYGMPPILVDGLKSQNRATQRDAAEFLGLEHPEQDFRNCDIRADTVKLEEKFDNSILQVRCGNVLSVVALRLHPPFSERLDVQQFHAPYDKTNLEFTRLISPSVQEVVIHNAATVSGSLYQAYFLVLRLAGRKLEVVLSSLETASEPRIGGVPRTQKSSFILRAASANEAGVTEQTVTVAIGKKSYVLRRSFGWSAEWQAFIEDEVATLRPVQ